MGDFGHLFENFDTFYPKLKAMIQYGKLQGLDLDPEDGQNSLDNIKKLVKALRDDFGPEFIISLTPTVQELIFGGEGLAGFDYFQLEKDMGPDISFYNAQFYNGWGDLHVTNNYHNIVESGLFNPLKVTAFTLTNPDSPGFEGFVPLSDQLEVVGALAQQYGAQFGGVAGRDYWNSLPGGTEEPWIWAKLMQAAMV